VAKGLRYLSTVKVTAAVCSVFHRRQLPSLSDDEYLAGVSPHTTSYEFA
jgi:hypothetical protein